MKQILFLSILGLASLASVSGQATRRPSPTPSKLPRSIPVKPGTSVRPLTAGPVVDAGKVAGRVYANTQFGFEIEFPQSWLIPDRDFEATMKKQGFDLRVANSNALPPAARAKFKQQVTVLLTVYRSLPGTPDNSVAIISVEDLGKTPQIKDAVDYIDVMREQFVAMRPVKGFTFSETQAEQLGDMQFAFIDTTSNGQKKRIYATVRRGYAILMTLSYSADEDLVAFRRTLAAGNFHLKATGN